MGRYPIGRAVPSAGATAVAARHPTTCCQSCVLRWHMPMLVRATLLQLVVVAIEAPGAKVPHLPLGARVQVSDVEGVGLARSTAWPRSPFPLLHPSELAPKIGRRSAKCQPAAGPAAMLLVDPPFGVDPDEWKAIRSKNEAAIKQQVSAAAAKATPQQLLQAAEKATRLRAELERQCAAATQKLEKLAQSLQDARAKEQECREASLRAQVPSVGELPCSADHLLDGLLAKAAPQLAGTPECNRLKRHLEEAVRVANAELGQRLEQAKAEADERAKADALKAQETAEAAATPAGGAPDMDWDLAGLDDDTLRAVDPSHQQPQGEGADEAMEGWRVVQRGKARKAAEVAGVLATHKKLKVDQLCG